MINEKQFVENYGFFWKSSLPLSNFFLREVNNHQVKGDFDFLTSQINGRRRSFLSEVSFKLLKDSYEYEYDFSDDTKLSERLVNVEKICRDFFKLYQEADSQLYDYLNEDEKKETIELSKRIKNFLNEYLKCKELLVYPKFSGCGFLDTCYGDILVDNILFELKMVNRNFQLNDFKQLIVYCTLNFLSNEHKIEKIGLYNPRKGKYVIYDLDEFCLNISGKTSTSLFSEVIEYVSSGELSK